VILPAIESCQALVAALALAIETARAEGLNADHVGGILTMAKHQALVFGISWASVVNDARIALGDGLGALLGSVSGSLLERDPLLPKG
jgi:hypothetical protein